MLTGAFLLVAALATPVATSVTNGGEVTYVTATSAYVDVGANDGLANGQQLKLFRGKRPVGTCEVVQLSAKRAICRGARVAAGDRFSFPVVPLPEGVTPAGRKVAPVERPPLPSKARLEALRAIVERAPLEKVPHTKSASFSLRGATTLRQEVWSVSTTPGGVFGRTSLDATARAGLGLPNLFAATSLRVLGDVVAPPDQRFRPGELVELYVWGASVGLSDGPVVGEVGRFYARKVPGGLLLDGAQVGTRFGTTEVGIYGGAIPELLSLAPSFNHLTAGAYVGSDVVAAEGVMVLPRARLGVASTADFATVRGDLEAQAQVLWQGIGTFGTTLRGGLGGTADLLPSLDAASVDADVVAIPSLRLSGGYRYFGRPPVDFDVIAKAPVIGGAHHASASADWEALSGLHVGLLSGLGFDDPTAALRGWVGPQLGLPQAFGSMGGLEVAYLEELGSFAGRSGYVATRLGLLPVLSLTTRVSYFETAALGDPLREIGLMTHLDAPIFPWLSLRGRAYAQQALPDARGGPRAAPTVLLVDLAATGAL